jgi:hypothetical protein
MKKLLVMVALTAIGLTTTSCQKEEINSSTTSHISRREENLDPQLPLNESPTSLNENEQLFNLINNSDEMNQIKSQGGLIENGKIIRFGDPEKFVVMFPQDSVGTTMNSWTISVYGKNIIKTNTISLKESNDYVFGTPYSGNIEIKDLEGNILVSGTMVNGKFPKWTPHGGYSTWADCFEHNSGTWWGVIGYVVAPGATLTGIGLGCL